MSFVVPANVAIGSYTSIAPGTMRNRWFPCRIADYVTPMQLKQLVKDGVDTSRDFTFGVRVPLEETEDDQDLVQMPKQHYVRPIEIDMLSVRIPWRSTIQGADADEHRPNDQWSS
jgi:hypothetical protein